MTLEEILAFDIYTFILTFARVGGAFAFLLGFSGQSMPMNVRLGLALFIALVLAPLTSPLLPAQPDSELTFFLYLAGETTIGVFFGLFTQLLMSAMQAAGTLIAMQSGLANAFVSDPALSSQSSVYGRILTQMSLVLIFATGLDHLMLNAIFESYSLFPPGQALPTGDMAEFFARVLNESYGMSLQLAAPFVVVALVFQAGLGMLAKLTPQIQIFFISQPAQVLGGLVLFATVLPAIVLSFASYFENSLENFLTP